MERISFEDVKAELKRVLMTTGLEDGKANRCAELFAENTRDGVYSHGLNRFPGFVQSIKSGKILIDVDAECVKQFGPGERIAITGEYLVKLARWLDQREVTFDPASLSEPEEARIFTEDFESVLEAFGLETPVRSSAQVEAIVHLLRSSFLGG